MDNRQFTIALTLMASLVAAGSGEARQSAEAIARAIVVGQAYPSGNVFVAGFDPDEQRAWPRQIIMVPLQEEAPVRLSADFFRTVTQDSEEQYYFPRRESAEVSDRDIFATIDRMALEDRNLARYRADDSVQSSVAFFGWDKRLPLADLSRRDRGQLRPTTARERVEIAADKKSSVPKDFECTTVPQFLDSAKVILTARITGSALSVRLSHYMTPGCAGHLSDIYILDVIVPGQESRRFAFRHYQGVL